jgi:uncharacterized membrane protein YwzB
MKENKLKLLRPLFILFTFLMAFLLLGRNWLLKKNVDVDIVVIGNLVLLIITLVSYMLMYRALQSANIHAFTRMMYVNFITKFFVIVAIVFVYAVLTKDINTAAVIMCMAIYFIYTMIESAALTKLLKRKNNA